MKKWIIGLAITTLIIIGIVIANQGGLGSSINLFKCEPEWIKTVIVSTDDDCKFLCYHEYKITSYKVEDSEITMLNETRIYPHCFCDINNCK